MIEDLRRRFLPRFVETSRERLARAHSLFEGGDAPTLAHELHALAGEAMMLDLGAVADHARLAEVAARAWSKASEDSGGCSRAACAHCLEIVGQALHALSISSPNQSGAP